jgi:hypothetical protein
MRQSLSGLVAKGVDQSHVDVAVNRYKTIGYNISRKLQFMIVVTAFRCACRSWQPSLVRADALRRQSVFQTLMP